MSPNVTPGSLGCLRKMDERSPASLSEQVSAHKQIYFDNMKYYCRSDHAENPVNALRIINSKATYKLLF